MINSLGTIVLQVLCLVFLCPVVFVIMKRKRKKIPGCLLSIILQKTTSYKLRKKLLARL